MDNMEFGENLEAQTALESEWGYDSDTPMETVDNHTISYEDRAIYMRLNGRENGFERRRYQLEKSEKLLKKKLSSLSRMSDDSFLEHLYEGVLPEGLKTKVLIRNLSMDGTQGENGILALRPERYQGDFLSEWIPDKKSIMFRGHLNGIAFVIDSIYDTPNEAPMDYEIKCEVTRWNDAYKVRQPFLRELISRSQSLVEHTREKLDDWEAYLQWDKGLLEAHVFGCRYTDLYIDQESGNLMIELRYPNYDLYKKTGSKLRRDVALFDLSYSQDAWEFRLADLNSRKRFRQQEIGAFVRIEDEYPLDIEDAEGQYVVKVSYELMQDDQQEYDDIDWQHNIDAPLDFNELNQRIRGSYQTDGFLAESAIGSLALNRRLKTAIEHLKQDIECYSPNLALWLFDIRQARLPEAEESLDISTWLNPDIANNENQKNAVCKILKSPDVCLIQGPPGTGKTTVIAEAIYQFTSRGNRVLIASQSNDAVDNALERLKNSPVIRAIRLGRSKRKKAQDETQDKFSEKTALKNFYRSLADNIDKRWIDAWNHGSEYLSGCVDDADTLNRLDKEILSLQEEQEKALAAATTSQATAALLRDEIQDALVHNEVHARKQGQLRLLQKMAAGQDIGEENLTIDTAEKLGELLNGLIDSAKHEGIKLLIGSINTKLFTSTMAIRGLFLRLFVNVGILEKLSGRLMEFSHGELDDVKSQIAGLNDRLDETEDDEESCQLHRKIKALKKKCSEINPASGNFELSSEEKNCVQTDFLDSYVRNGNFRNAGEKIANIIRQYHEAMRMAVIRYNEELENEKLIDVSELEARKEAIDAQMESVQVNVEQSKDKIESSLSLVDEMREKYLPESGSVTIPELLKVIEDRQSEIQQKLEQSEAIRDSWGDTLQGFRNRLMDKSLFAVDQQYYQTTYVNACNVVGVSCTANMRDLNDRNYEDFDVVIIDEVSKATPPELLIPLMKARKAVLVGDHRQLPPMFQEHEKSYSEMVEEQADRGGQTNGILTMDHFKRFKKMVTASLFKEYFEQADDKIKHSLLVQYRMHSDIMAVINRFYENKLTAGLSLEQETIRKNHGLTIPGVNRTRFIRPECHAYWIDSSTLPNGRELYENFQNGSTSAANILEKYIIIELLRRMAEEYTRMGYGRKKKKTVGIISFYMRQIREIKVMYQQARKNNPAFNALDVAVNTVDRFQGQEKNIIICSLVRNNKQAKASGHVVAFERINVAFSRAQEMLVIVGAKHLYQNSMVKLPYMDRLGEARVPVYKNIMEELNRKAAFASSNKIITAEVEKKILSIVNGMEKKRGIRKN